MVVVVVEVVEVLVAVVLVVEQGIYCCVLRRSTGSAIVR